MSRGHVRLVVVALAALLSAAPGAAAAATATTAAGHSRRAPRRPHRSRHAARVAPRAFASCAGLVSYARHYYSTTHGIADPPVAPIAGAQTFGTAPSGTVAPSAPTPAAATNGASNTTSTSGSSSFSTTNDQEQGVNEPDIVKTDGSTIFAVSGNTLYAVATAAGRRTWSARSTSAATRTARSCYSTAPGCS